MSKYSEFSKEELLALVEKQDNELSSKKYGLVWDAEREPEKVVLDCENNLPVLKRVKGKEVREPKNNSLEDNILIEGDNYHALTVLNYTHQEKIDVIYIDPPYNTGNKDFKYNDKYVDREDGYRHSKWLNFMEKRLNLAKDLLSDSGVIFISIDDHEQAQLRLLCDLIFGAENFIGEIIRKTKSMTGDEGAGFNLQHEILIIYSKNKRSVNLFGEDKDYNAYKNPDNDIKGDWVSGDPSAKSGGDSTYFKIVNPYTKNYDLPPLGRYWAFSQNTLKEYIKNGKIVFKKKYKKDERGFIFKRYKNELKENTNPVNSLFAIDSDFMNQVGTKELKEIFNKEIFNNPKPTSFIKKIIKFSSKNNSTVLDFMAGSGTTGHAVLELNKEDGGNRKFILCTNNENKICEEITYPRLERVIRGYKKNGDGEKVEGLGGNLQYFRTDLIKKTSSRTQIKIDLTNKCTEMLCVKENIFNLETEKEDFKIFSSNSGDKFLCVYYNLISESFKDFLKEIKKLKGEKKIYAFSMNNEFDKNLFNSIDNFVLEAVPQKILDVYKKLVKMNISI